ncbi:MAG: tetratricopeptide (TPR) repeat protein, partial [Phenylobacterium sp.]
QGLAAVAKNNDSAVAEQAFVRALDIAPTFKAPRVALARIQMLSGDLAQAALLLGEHIGKAPHDYRAYLALAEVYRTLKKPAKQGGVYRQLLDLSPNNADVLALLAEHDMSLKKYGKAVESFKRLLNKAPNNRFALAGITRANFALNFFKKAAETAKKLVANQPNSQNYQLLGMSLFYSGSYDQAALAFEAALKITPNDHALWGKLGDSYRLDSNEKQTAAYQKATELAMHSEQNQAADSRTLAALSYYLVSLGKTALAVHYLNRISVRDDGQSQFSSGLAYARLGDIHRALAHLRYATYKGFAKGLIRHHPLLGQLKQDSRFATWLAQ